MKFIWAVVLLLGPPGLVSSLPDNYCERNETVREMVPMTGQRQIVNVPSKWKFWKKTEKKTESYDFEGEQITYRMVRECCAGYRKMESGICEPICTRACPAYASCAAPNRCECIGGYVSAKSHHNGSHYCEPICQRACPSGAQCVRPNTCACREGYAQLKPAGDGVSGDCVPTCQVGEGCANGRCIDVERCSCNAGYRWDRDDEMCVEVSAESISEEQDSTEESVEDIASSSTAALIATDCQEDFVLFRGECREKQFNSDEEGCQKTGCGPHQTCQESGICHCSDGYVQEEVSVENGTLTCRRTLLDQLLSLNEATDTEGELNPWTIPIIGVACGAIFVLLIAGLLGGRRYRREREAASSKEMDCQYSQKTLDADEYVP
ncbi:hypothetical protein KR009_009619 [Drosophila setifemur]|nr:hypothetical protein KR009_009619 [Drosophila setifemur]